MKKLINRIKSMFVKSLSVNLERIENITAVHEITGKNKSFKYVLTILRNDTEEHIGLYKCKNEQSGFQRELNKKQRVLFNPNYTNAFYTETKGMITLYSKLSGVSCSEVVFLTEPSIGCFFNNTEHAEGEKKLLECRTKSGKKWKVR